jgi:hypothetical protein
MEENSVRILWWYPSSEYMKMEADISFETFLPIYKNITERHDLEEVGVRLVGGT